MLQDQSRVLVSEEIQHSIDLRTVDPGAFDDFDAPYITSSEGKYRVVRLKFESETEGEASFVMPRNSLVKTGKNNLTLTLSESVRDMNFEIKYPIQFEVGEDNTYIVTTAFKMEPIK